MATKRKPWPKNKETNRCELVDGASRLYGRCKILWEYGCTGHNFAYLRTELPIIKATCERHVLAVRGVLKDTTRSTSRAMIADLNEVKGIMYQMIMSINQAEGYISRRDWDSALRYAGDLQEYAWEFYKLMEEYRE